MAEIAVEYVILIPLLMVQIFLFPYAANLIMSNWTTQSRTLALQDAASQLGSSIQQLYSALNHVTVTSGSVTSSLGIPSSISGYVFYGNASLITAGLGSAEVLNLTLTFVGSRVSASTTITLGENAQWQQSSSFMSNSTTACINANKNSSGTVLLSFGS
jgi:hypothetical protein